MESDTILVKLSNVMPVDSMPRIELSELDVAGKLSNLKRGL